MMPGLNISTLQNRDSSSKIDIYGMDDEEFEFRFGISKGDYFDGNIPIALKKDVNNFAAAEKAILSHFETNCPNFKAFDSELIKLKELLNSHQIVFK